MSHDDAMTIIDKTCVQCGKHVQIEVRVADLIKRENGALIQHAFPNMPPEQREMFISGICGTCWDTMFKEPEEWLEDIEIISEDAEETPKTYEVIMDFGKPMSETVPDLEGVKRILTEGYETIKRMGDVAHCDVEIWYNGRNIAEDQVIDEMVAEIVAGAP